MNSVPRFADRKPFIFVVGVLVAWILLGSIFVILAATLFRLPITDPKIQAAGTLIATILLLCIAIRISWIDGIGIVNLGSPSLWMVTLIVAIYVLLVNSYAYFDEITFLPASLFTQDAVPLLLRGLQVGFVEEVVFRGIILYGLVRTWGKSNRGLFAALAVQAALFSVLHTLQVFFGADLASAISNVLATFIFGLWVGALVVSFGSLWPAILIHAVSNSFILINGLSNQWVIPNYLGFLRGSLFELPLVLLGLWFVLKRRSDAHLDSDDLSNPLTSA